MSVTHLNKRKDLDLSYKMDLDLFLWFGGGGGVGGRDSFGIGMKKLCLITKEILYSLWYLFSFLCSLSVQE